MLRFVRDFHWSLRGVTVKETGAFVPFDAALRQDVTAWLAYYRKETARLSQQTADFTVYVAPRPMRPWYLWWGVVRRAGGRFVSRPDQADICLHFEDSTYVSPRPPPGAALALNYRCTDISKSRVDAVFESVFGYALSIDPQTHDGPFVRKSDINGTHSGEVMTRPCAKDPGFVYQRLIDNQTDDGTVADIRCPTIGGEIALTFIKERPTEKRFANLNTRCTLTAPEAWLSPEEIANVSRFCQEMKLDFGGLDILRDKETQRIYIVDVNKTDMGPPLALPLPDKLKSVDLLADVFRARVMNKDSAQTATA